MTHADIAEINADVAETNADLRTGGSWTTRQRIKNDALWLLASALLAAARPLPPGVLGLVGRAIGAGVYRLASAARTIALANVGRALPALDENARRALVRLCFVTLGENLGDTVALLGTHARPPLAIDDESRRTLDQARAEGRGVLFASAHLGPWERVAEALVAAGIPLVTLARESYDPRFSRLYERVRSRTGVGVLWRGSPRVAFGILRTLRSGGVLGAPMDLRARVASIDVPFLGHPAPTAIGPARIALRAGAAVIVGTAAPADELGDRADGAGRPLVVTATRIPTHDLPSKEAGARELTARINAELSRRILALPHAWVWMHRR